MRALFRLWALPTTGLGLLLAIVTGCRPRRHVDGDRFWLGSLSSPWEWWRKRSGRSAITIGTVTICAVWPSRALLDHELRHQRQALILGPFYVPAYLIGCVIGWVRGDWYRRNPMEVDARGE